MKFVFYFLLALGAALYFPQSRAVITDLAEPVIHPVLRWSTSNELDRIVGDLQNEVDSRRWLPEGEEEFQDWMEDSYQSEDSRLDSWGRPYILRMGGQTFDVTSAGPDGEFGTADDIVATGDASQVRR